jgi:hypothetical protein
MQQELRERLLASDDPKVVAYYITEGPGGLRPELYQKNHVESGFQVRDVS